VCQPKADTHYFLRASASLLSSENNPSKDLIWWEV
jgi:hypothetical protein